MGDRRPGPHPDYGPPPRFRSMERPMLKAAGVAAGTLFIAVGLAAQFGGADMFGTPSYHPVSEAPALAQHPTPAATPLSKPTPTPSPQEVTAAGTIYPYVAYAGAPKKKKGGKGR